ncbi:MAG: peptidylprolyl isomerase [Clostridium sp.]
MSKIKKIIALATLGMLSFSIVGCKMIEKTPEAIKNTVLAKYGSEEITKGELDESLKYVYDQLKASYGEDFESKPDLQEGLKKQKLQQLNALVDEKIALEKAKELNLIPSDEELNKEVDERVKFYKDAFGGEEGFVKQYKAYGYETEEDFRGFLKNQVIVGKVVDHIQKDVTISEEEAKKFYDDNKALFTKQPGAEVSHILIKDEAKAKEIRQRAANGEDFAKLATEFTEDPGSKSTGGSYGYIEYSSEKYVPEFINAVRAGEEGQISDLVKTDYGYHIVKTTGVLKVAEETSFDSIKEKLMTESVTLSGGQAKDLLSEKKSEKLQTTLEEWRKEKNVKIYESRL